MIWLFFIFCIIAASFLWLTDRERRVYDKASIELANNFHCVILRYDLHVTRPQELTALVGLDQKLGIRASLFAMSSQFELIRNELLEAELYYKDIQPHLRIIPGDMLDYPPKLGEDAMPYSMPYLDPAKVTEALYANLDIATDIFTHNGFSPRGLSLHSASNRLPWDDITNYRSFGAASAKMNLDWISVTTKEFSIGQQLIDHHPKKLKNYNKFDGYITVRQVPFFVSVQTSLYASQRTLVIPTSWRDSRLFVLVQRDLNENEFDSLWQETKRDIFRQWKAAKENNSPLVLLLHPSPYLVTRDGLQMFSNIRHLLIEKAKEDQIPILTMSEYYQRVVQ